MNTNIKKYPTDINETFSFMAEFAHYAYHFDSQPDNMGGIPSHFHIDKGLTTDDDNVVMVSDTFKMVVWSIKGTVFNYRNFIDDFNILLSGKYTNVFNIQYYIDKMSAIIKKYKEGNNKNFKYELYLSSHSLGANKQQYLLFAGDTPDKYFIDNINGCFNFAMGGSPIAAFLKSATSALLSPLKSVLPTSLNWVTEVGGLSYIHCNNPAVCKIAKEKNFILALKEDPIGGILLDINHQSDLGNVAQFIVVPVSEPMMLAAARDLNKLGFFWRQIQSVKNYFLYHSTLMFINDYRRGLIDMSLEEIQAVSDPEEVDLSETFYTGGRFGTAQPKTETFTFKREEFIKYIQQNKVIGPKEQDPVKAAQREIAMERKEAEEAIKQEAIKQEQLKYQLVPYKKIIFTSTNIDTELLNMSKTPSILDKDFMKYFVQLSRSGPLPPPPPPTAHLAMPFSPANPPLKPIAPKNRVQSSPFAVPPQGIAIGGRQGLPLMPQQYLGLPSGVAPVFTSIHTQAIKPLIPPKVKPEFSKKVHAAPILKPSDSKLKGRTKPNIPKLKKELHEAAIQEASAKKEIKFSTINKGFIQNQN